MGALNVALDKEREGDGWVVPSGGINNFLTKVTITVGLCSKPFDKLCC